jgi:prolyl oligopeptidase
MSYPRSWLAGAVLLASTTVQPQAIAAPAPRPAPPPVKPVTETHFGTVVTDRYRYMEDEKDTSVTDWIKAEGRYARAFLDALPGRADVFSRMSAFTGSFDFVSGIQRAGDRTFYQERMPGSDNYDLLVRNSDGTTKKLVDVAALRATKGGRPMALNYFQPSRDGSKVAVGLSEGGSENANLTVIDVDSGKTIAGPIERVQFGAIGWMPDGSRLFFHRFQELAPGDPSMNKYKNSKTLVWDLKNPPVAVLGKGVGRIAFTEDEFPIIGTTPGSDLALAINANGVQNEIALWTAPLSDAVKPNAAWTPLVARSDDVTNAAVSGNRIYLLSHKNAPTFQVLSIEAGQPISAAKVIVPARSDRLIESISTAADGLYVRARRGVYSELFKVPLEGGPEQPLPLPFKGSISELFADPREPGAIIQVDGWTTPPTTLAFQPSTGQFSDLKLGMIPAGFDPKQFRTEDLTAKAADGTAIPLSYLTVAGGKHPRPLLLWAYGSYGLSEFPYFGTRVNMALREGIDYAVCHVRGGGELGEAWRLAGKDANKPNTWRDLIACAEDLIARGYTTKSMLFIGGGSAGGITMGRAMQERPDLFAGVFNLVPGANALRMEFSVSGPANIPEFGSIKTEQGFKNLMAMDTIYHVKPGTQYPPIMITTGLNDPRVSSWAPAKLAATLLASGTKNPVLLRVDEDGGHGIGSTKTQNDELYADILTFIKWRVAQNSGTSSTR